MSDFDDVLVRKATDADCEALAACHLVCWRETYGDQLFSSWRSLATPGDLTDRWRLNLATPGSEVAVGDTTSEIVGFARSAPSRDPDAVLPLELCSLYVRRRLHRTRLPDALIDAVLGERPAFLWVPSENQEALAFYQARGFYLDGTVKRHPSAVVEYRLQRCSDPAC